MATAHCQQVAWLHLNHLPTNFRGEPGIRLLEIYYRSLMESNGGVGYVACNVKDVVGFVCGVWDRKSILANMLKHQPIKLTVWGGAQILINPKIGKDIFRRLASGFFNASSDSKDYELRPIVVAPEWRGSGVANELLGVLLDDALRRGYPRIHLYAENSNLAANAFYRKAGFTQINSTSPGRDNYLHYEISTTKHLPTSVSTQ